MTSAVPKIIVVSEVITVLVYLTWRCIVSADSDGCCSTQLIDGDGAFNVTGIDSFIKEVKLGECGLSYAIVSIMGPQSSGMQPYFLKYIDLLFFDEIFQFSSLVMPWIKGLFGSNIF